MTSYWASTERMTVLVVVDERGVVVDGAPVIRKFVGQPAGALWSWLRKQGGFRVQALPE